MSAKATLRMRLAGLVVLFGCLVPSQSHAQFTTSNGGVWVWDSVKLSFTRKQWNPSNGTIGNMGGGGVLYDTSTAVAGAVPAGAPAQESNAFKAWNAFGAIPSVRIKFTPAALLPDCTIQYALLNDAAGDPETPAETTNAVLGAGRRDITVHQTVNSVITGTSQDSVGPAGGPSVIDIYDVWTDVVHEVGHVVGLGHPESATVEYANQIMTPQDTSRQKANGLYRTHQVLPAPPAVAPITYPAPFGAYPNAAFGFWGDAMGAISLYSAPLVGVTSNFKVGGAFFASGGGTYTYTVQNQSARGTASGGATQFRSGYQVRHVTIPVSAGVSLANLTVSDPTNWALQQVSGGLDLHFIGNDMASPFLLRGGLLPGATVTFSFDASVPSMPSVPNVRWNVDGVVDGVDVNTAACESSVGGGFAFDYTNFTVNDGTATYQFNTTADRWDVVQLAPIDAPLVITGIPAPAQPRWTLAVLIASLLFVGGLMAARSMSAAKLSA